MSAQRPNILFVMTDDQTVRELSAYGLNSILQTPNMDRIASAGTRFDRCYCTNALCAPSRATVLTGLFSHANGITGNSEKAGEVEALRSDIPTYPELLQQAGYQTCLVGKYHIRQNPRGFDHWAIHPGQGRYFDPEYIINGKRVAKQGYSSDLTTDMALEFLRSADRERPFCLVYQFKAPHRPFSPAPRHAEMFSDVEVPKPATYDDDHATRKIAEISEDMKFEVSLERDYDDLPQDLTAEQKREWIFQRFMKDRFRTIFGVDENLGRVLDHLQAEDLFDDTLILYTSDHGYFLADHGWYDKRFMYEPAVQIPLVASYPRGCPKGLTSKALAMNIDFTPTILDFAGVDIPAGMHGRSLRPILEGAEPDDWRQATYYAYYEDSWRLVGAADEDRAEPYRYFTPHRVGPHRGVRTERYKLIEYYTEGDYWELFDLEADPNELRNVYLDPDYAGVAAEMKSELNRQRRLYNDLD
jgi:arylsulfatase A-like enzyme